MRYSSAKLENSYGGSVFFSAGVKNKKGVVIVIETKIGVRFGCFFTASIPFHFSKTESHLDNYAVLFNISNKKSFKVQKEGIKSVHTSTKALGVK